MAEKELTDGKQKGQDDVGLSPFIFTTAYSAGREGTAII